MDGQNYARVIFGLCLLVVATTSQAVERSDVGLSEAEGFSLTTGLEYESGDYGTPYTTDLWRIPVGVDYVKGRFSAGVSTAYLDARSTGTITVSSGMSRMNRVTTTSSTTVNSASGMGDVDMYASYRLPSADETEISYHVTGRIKLGTADKDKGLGTGENDYALEGGTILKFADIYLYGNLGYQIVGDSTTVNYDNVWYANAGATYPLQNRRSVGALLEVSQAATPGFDAPAQLTLFYNHGLAQQRELYFYVLFGLSNGSPDTGVGANLTVKL